MAISRMIDEMASNERNLFIAPRSRHISNSRLSFSINTDVLPFYVNSDVPVLISRVPHRPHPHKSCIKGTVTGFIKQCELMAVTTPIVEAPPPLIRSG